MGFRRFTLPLLTGLCVACVGGEQRPFEPIIQMDGSVIPNQGSTDMFLGSFRDDVGPMTSERSVWLMYSADEYVDGPRAELSPAHRALMSADEVVQILSPAVILMEWEGPMTPSDARLGMYSNQTDHEVIPVYRPPVFADDLHRQETIRDHARYLLAQYSTRPGLHHLDGRLVLGLDWSAERHQGARVFADAVHQTGVAVFWSGPSAGSDDFPWDLAYRWSDCLHTDLDEFAGREDELLCFGPPAWNETTAVDLSLRSIRSRRAADRTGIPLLIDGVSSWSSDRQLIPVDGPATAEPNALTDGRTIRPYGDERLQWIERLTRVSLPTKLVDLSDEQTSTLSGSGELVLAKLDGALSLTWHPQDASAAVLLNSNPISLPMNMRLNVSHMDPGTRLVLVFADGQSVSLNRAGLTEILNPSGPRRLEDVIFLYDAVDGATELHITGLRFIPIE